MWNQWLEATKPIIPVIVIDDIEQAVPLAQALVAGGVHLLEITLRTPQGLDAIRLIREQVDGAIVGAGTVTNAVEFEQSLDAGAEFVVSPGISAELFSCAQHWGGAYLPGVATASDVLQARAAGFYQQKFFPAEAAGGLAMLNALSGPFSDVSFCPTGGIGMNNYQSYLKSNIVFAVGGSWLTPKDKVSAADWSALTTLAMVC